MTTRVLGYLIGGNGGAGPLLAVGTLIAPFLVLLQPDLTQETEDDMWRGLRAHVLPRPMGDARLRLVVEGPGGSEVIDGRVYHTADSVSEWQAAVLLDRATSAPASGLPAATGRGRSYRSGMQHQIRRSVVTITDRDRDVPRPKAPARFAAAEPAAPGAPTFWPHGVDFPVVDEVVKVVLNAFSCKRWPCFLWCPC